MKNSILNGLLLVDKEAGLTSHQLVAHLRKLFKQKRIGHTGTLDPMATGLMQIILGEATKLSPYLTSLGKSYQGEILLGKITDTDDITGQVLQEYQGQWPSEHIVKDEMKSFLGESEQRPPAFSAIKINGERAYKLARKNEKVEMPLRKVVVDEFCLNKYEPPLIYFTAFVSSGCYIRSLARDLGTILKTGATLNALRRTTVGSFNVEQAYTVSELAQIDPLSWENKLIKANEALVNLNTYRVENNKIDWVKNGRFLPIETKDHFFKEGEAIKIIDENGLLLAIYEYKTNLNNESLKSAEPFLRSRRIFLENV